MKKKKQKNKIKFCFLLYFWCRKNTFLFQWWLVLTNQLRWCRGTDERRRDEGKAQLAFLPLSSLDEFSSGVKIFWGQLTGHSGVGVYNQGGPKAL